MIDTAVMTCEIPGLTSRSGKVREVFDLPADTGQPPLMLMVATDRISAYDVIMPTPIAGKGILLNEISTHWLRWIEGRELARTHLMTIDDDAVLSAVNTALRTKGADALSDEQAKDLAGRAALCKPCKVVPIECVVRGYLEGSGWAEYQQTSSVCGVQLPQGLQRGDRLPEPIFTPATKAEMGEHDENITFEKACDIAGERVMNHLRAQSIAIYEAAHAYAHERGLILADTKFEFGLPLNADGAVDEQAEPLLIDEALTPDSSRYWPVEKYNPGGEQISYDKQFLREHLTKLVEQDMWNKQDPGPPLPGDVVEGTRGRYRQALERLFG